jgi:hypothetical protein
MAIVINACYSGSAIPYLHDEDRIIITSSPADKPSYQYFNSFLSRGINDFDFADYAIGIGDKNGVVSVEELFEYYIGEFHPNVYPQPRIDDNYPGQLHLVFKNWSEGIIDQIPDDTFRYNGSFNIGMISENSSHFAAAQSFVPNKDILTVIKLKAGSRIFESSENPDNLKVSIRLNLTGEDLSSATLNCSQIRDFHNNYIVFDIPDLNVTSGKKYYIVCQTQPSPGIEWYPYYWLGRKSNIYNEGECYISENDGDTWSLSNDYNDLIFAIYGKSKNKSLPPYVPKRPAGSVRFKKNTNYSFFVSTEDFTQDKIYYMLDWDDGTNYKWYGLYNSGIPVCINHSWTEEGIYKIRVKAKDKYDSESGYSDFLKVFIDEEPPDLKITKPENALYLFNFKIRKYLIRIPLIIGKINIEVNATDNESGIDRTEFYIDNESKANISSKPYEYIWKQERRTIFKHMHTIRVIAYDKAGNSNYDEITVRKFL